jgi:hypothetical protein
MGPTSALTRLRAVGAVCIPFSSSSHSPWFLWLVSVTTLLDVWVSITVFPELAMAAVLGPVARGYW